LNNISIRLRAVADFINHSVIADIGCDHAYACIYAVASGKADCAYACDVNEGPLSHAAQNIAAHNLTDKIETRLGGGLAPVCGTNAETVIIAGLGGYQIMEILRDGIALMPAVKQLILQPMSEIPEVREYVVTSGFSIESEAIVREGKKFYFIINCAPGRTDAYGEEELLLGRPLVREKNKIFAAYLMSEIKKTRAIIKKIDGNTAKDASLLRRDELVHKLRICEGVLRRNAHV